MDTGIAKNIAIWNSRAEEYDKFRPRPPAVILDLFTQLTHTSKPQLVVDLGSGTGLSTLLWAPRAQRVVGIEPNDEMRRRAEIHKDEQNIANVQFRSSISSQTGLPDGSADIVTCSQSLHWMEPASTFAEIARILCPGGLFAAYDYDWPPTVNWQAEQAYADLEECIEQIRNKLGIGRNVQSWPKHEHLARIQASGHFRFTKEILVHHVEEGNAERFVGLALSNYIAEYLQRGLREEEIGFDRFKASVHNALGEKQWSFYFSYHIRMGIK
ncbi:class I SAM-dependent methyltransferase [Ktedonosporobacter rubrisoli]|uniref:Class I SAM-dependent methyltransferase n=1 Tax=Ktedonosporobacter rubrisoli TaxID=2509675 RepID=A0A4P6K2G8_KTERU|nr:class I SAM-dependent methyltransferase [Ktedonosporobacter rubrisoli]QBD82339.1 class I SAM-dependent methyltransferase [Ktedonosporobacter rubrisoli]